MLAYSIGLVEIESNTTPEILPPRKCILSCAERSRFSANINGTKAHKYLKKVLKDFSVNGMIILVNENNS
jgi:hypothetical protein